MNRGSMRQGLLSALQQVITDMLPNGYPSITSTAAQIGISVRTLQRRLAESGVKYSEFVARVRFEQACRDLENPRITLGKVSVRLGYRDPSSFSRAFTRWAGMSPRQYRKQLIVPADHDSAARHLHHSRSVTKTPDYSR